MRRSRARRRGLVVAAVVAVVAASGAPSSRSERSLLERAKEHIESHRFDDAAEALEAAAQASDGDERREAWFLLAGLKRSAEDAEALYRRVVDDDAGSEWARRSVLELAKVQYALGNYSAAYDLLADGEACGISDEACLFHGLSAMMLKRYDDARAPLAQVGQGRLRTWASISLAEADMAEDRKDEACGRYESLSNAMIIPTALYRFGECLEDRGDVEGAKREYREIIKNFRDTPEAVLAAEKLQVIDANAAAAAEQTKAPGGRAGEDAGEADAPGAAGMEVLESGFTLQFGSFIDRGNAIKLSTKIKRVFPGVRIDSELVRFREHYRVRYGYFRTREEAQAKGEEIAREIDQDFTIMPIP